MIAAAVLAEARSWLGTPYHHQASIKGVGVDCAMLLIAVFHACGLVPDIDPRPYSPEWMLHRDEEQFLGWLQQYGVETDDPQPGDVLVWRFGRTFSHGAILVDVDGTIVHAYQQARCVTLSSRHDSDLSARKMKSYRVQGMGTS
jgi:NlpC/P60 family putative phage cell wall peptidase